MAKLLAGKAVVDGLNAKLQSIVAGGQGSSSPRLLVVQVGDDPSSQAYLKGIQGACGRVGVQIEVSNFPDGIPQDQVANFLRQADGDPRVNGILVMRPLPRGYDEEALGELLSPKKDVDCFSSINTGRVMAGVAGGFPPCTPQAVMETLEYYQIPLQGKHVVVLGRSLVVGRPLAMLMTAADATVTICHSRTEDLAKVCRQADVLVAAVGKHGLVTGEMVKTDAVVVDVGINFVAGKLVGDVDFDSVAPQVEAITPVPGGIGTVTSAVMAKHVVTAWAANQRTQ